MDVRIEESWKQQLAEEFSKPYFEQLTQFVRQEYAAGTCYPPGRHSIRFASSSSVKTPITAPDKRTDSASA